MKTVDSLPIYDDWEEMELDYHEGPYALEQVGLDGITRYQLFRDASDTIPFCMTYDESDVVYIYKLLKEEN